MKQLLLFTLITLGAWGNSIKPKKLNEPVTSVENVMQQAPQWGEPMNLQFTENKGQYGSIPHTSSKVLYMADYQQTKVLLTAEGLSYIWLPSDKSAPKNDQALQVMHVKLKGANPTPRITAEEKSLGTTNYYLSDHPEGVLDVESFHKIRYHEVYPFIDFVVYSVNNQLKYDFIVKPGGKAEDIRLVYSNAKALRLQEDGSLLVKAPNGELNEGAPYVYLRENAEKQVPASYWKKRNEVGFRIANYDRRKTLIIDPQVSWNIVDNTANYTGLGDVTVQKTTDNIFVLGGKRMVVAGSLTYDVYIKKYNTAGQVLKTVEFGGSGDEAGTEGITLDAQGNVYIFGSTRSSNLPTTVGVLQRTFGGGLSDAFIAKFTNELALSAASYMGGTGFDVGQGGIVTDGTSVYVFGATGSTNFPVKNAFQATNKGSASPAPGAPSGGNDAFVSKLTPTLTLDWSTYFGGTGGEFDWGSIAITPQNNVVIRGATTSTNLPLKTPVQGTYGGGGNDAFVAQFTSTGALGWSTYHGGNGEDAGIYQSITTDNSNNVYVVGTTSSTNFPLITPYQNTLKGTSDAYITKFNSTGGRVWSTYLGGTNMEGYVAAKTNSSGELFVYGSTSSADFPTLSAFQSTYAGGHSSSFPVEGDLFLSKFTTNGGMLFSTYYGTSGMEAAWGGLAITSKNELILLGDQNINSAWKPLLVKILDIDLPKATISGGGTICSGATATIQVAFTGTAPWTFTYTNGNTSQTVSTSANPHSFTTSTAGTYTLTSFRDAGASGTFSGSAIVTTRPLPTATLTGGGVICNGSPVNLSVALTGTAPWTLVYTDGTTPKTITSSTSPVIIPITAPGTFTLVSVKDAYCTGTTSGSVQVTSATSPQAAEGIKGCKVVSTGATSQDYRYSIAFANPINTLNWSILSPAYGAQIVGVTTGTEVKVAFTELNPAGDKITLQAVGGNACGSQAYTLEITLDKTSVWPGDVNYDGKIAPIDFNVFTAIQPYLTNRTPGDVARVAQCTDKNCLNVPTYAWQPQPAKNWPIALAPTTPASLKAQVKNLKHFDTNGNGTIESTFDINYDPSQPPCLDSDVIKYNLANAVSKTHAFNAYRVAATDVSNAIQLRTVQDEVIDGFRQVLFEVALGEITPQLNITGLAFEITLSTGTWQNPQFIYFDDDFMPYALGTQGLDMLTMNFVKISDPKTIVVAMQRLDNAGVNFYGQVLMRVGMYYPVSGTNRASVQNASVATVVTPQSLNTSGVITSYQNATAPFGSGTTAVKTLQRKESNSTNGRLVSEVFPNPTQDILTLQLAEKLQDGQLELYDMRGKLVLQQKVSTTAKSLQLDLSSYTKGFYVLKITSSKGVEQRKIRLQ